MPRSPSELCVFLQQHKQGPSNHSPPDAVMGAQHLEEVPLSN